MCVAAFPACDDSFSDSAETSSELNVSISRPEEAADARVISETLTARNVSSGREQQYNTITGIQLLPGLYDLTYEAELELASGAHSTLRAAATSVQVTGSSTSVKLEGYNNIESDDLIIAEVFFAGTTRNSGNQYNGDDYVKLYNNTDHVIYADGITLFESKFTTTDKYEHSPNIMNEAMNVQALYTVPGSGKDHPVQPGEYFLICDTGIDHRVANPNSFDLSGADFEWYDESTNPSNFDIDSPLVPNMDKWYCYTLSFWVLHNRGFKAYGIARIPVGRDEYLKHYTYHYDWIIVSAAGTFPMTADSYKLPNEWIVDVVTCSVESKYAWNLCAPQLDCGWTHCGTIDQDKTRYFHSVRRKMLRLNEDGSISSRDNSFVINPDGTGHFAGGRFRWSQDAIELRDVTIRWEDLDEEAQELLKPRSVSLTGGTAFHFTDGLSGACEPENIPLVATEYNFEPESRQWEYLAADGIWKDAGCNAAVFEMTPPFHGWEGRDVLTLRYTATYRNEKVSATHTFFKLYDGSPAYTVYVESENGTTFRNGIISTVLRARVYRGGEEITPLIPDGNFRWIRTSRDTESDRIWNAAPHSGREIEITGGDVWRKAVFDCEVNISTTLQ